jgi:hypothetical protein
MENYGQLVSLPRSFIKKALAEVEQLMGDGVSRRCDFCAGLETHSHCFGVEFRQTANEALAWSGEGRPATGEPHGGPTERPREVCDIEIVQPIGDCDGSRHYAYDSSKENGRGAPLASECPGCRACY